MPTGTNYFVYDEAGRLLGEYDNTGAAVTETVYLNDTPVALLKGSTRYYVHADHLDTPRAITDTANKVIWRWNSDPFGTTLATQDPDKDGVAFVYNPRFPGQYYDKETGLHYNYYRDYDPRTGRYVQSDPIGLDGGVNTYAYVLGNPLRYFDSDGLEVRFICRYVKGLESVGAKHCFVYVTCPEEGNWSAVLSLFSSNFTYTGRKAISIPGTIGSEDYPDQLSSPNITDDITILPKKPQECSIRQCDPEKRVLNAYYSFPSGDVSYGVMGPNSNTFAQELITRAGGTFGDSGISNAPGMRR